MSTKISHGYRLRQNYSIFDFRTKFASVMTATAKTKQMNRFTFALMEFVDKIDLKDKKSAQQLRAYKKKIKPFLSPSEKNDSRSKSDHFQTIFDLLYMEDHLKEKDDEWRSQNECSVTLLHNPIRNENYLLFYGSREFQKVFENFSEIEEFGYWDNSDHPDNLTEEEWDDRGAAWNEAADLDLPMGIQGFLINPFSKYGETVRFNEYLEFVSNSPYANFPDKEYRADVCIRFLLINEYLATLEETGGPLMLGDMGSYIRESDNMERVGKHVRSVLKEVTKEDYVKYLTRD